MELLGFLAGLVRLATILALGLAALGFLVGITLVFWGVRRSSPELRARGGALMIHAFRVAAITLAAVTILAWLRAQAGLS